MGGQNVRTCGRPTRAGKPCRAQVYGFDVVCGVHATDQDRAVAEAYRKGYLEGCEAQRSRTFSSAEHQIERLERRVKELEQQLDDATRVYEVDGAQAVEVGGYAYLWRGDAPLKVGDHVLLPENYISRIKEGPGPTRGVVSRLGITYTGELSTIVRRLPQERG